MNMNEIIIAVVSLCVISAIIGIALSMAEKIFHVEVNEQEVAVREALPGSNCGGCGYAGCDAGSRGNRQNHGTGSWRDGTESGLCQMQRH